MTRPHRKLLIYQMVATFFFMGAVGSPMEKPFFSWAAPLAMILLIVVNSVWFTRLTSWVVFSVSFFGFLVVLSAFTLRWRLEPGFNAFPFYKTMGMYASFIYVSLAQIKILGKEIP